MEAYTNRPTEGCLGAKRDTPIHQRAANGTKLIRIRSDQPVGYKAHSLREMHERDRNATEGPMGVILVTRDPVTAISSQTTRILSNRRKYPWVTSRRKRIVIQEQIDLYLALVFRYASQNEGSRVHVRFEDLVSKKTADRAVNEFLNKLGVSLNGPSLTEISALAKESQTSLGTKGQDLKREIEEEVQERLTYEEVLSYIQQ